jgi:predicted PurR-regulated permease PerM
MPAPFLASYILAAAAVVAVLYYHLLSAVLSGLAVYVLTVKLGRHLPTSWGAKVHGVALLGILLIVVLLVLGAFLGLWAFIQSHEGVTALLPAIAERLDDVKKNLPAELTRSIPDSVEELRAKLATVLRQHSKDVTHFGVSGARIIVHVLLGMAIGSIAVMHRFKETDNAPPLASAMHQRLRRLADAFDRVVFAQVKISALNTVLTTLYLALILPLCGVHLPMVSLLILLTFITGLLPIVGNLISNTVIVVISLGESVGVGAASVGFLLLVHKLEYFTNAKIVGGSVEASTWELLSAMLFMEAVFGISGLIAAPVVYAWLKAELKALEQV